MKEAKYFCVLLPSFPDFDPIIVAVRGEYELHEISSDDEPITEI